MENYSTLQNSASIANGREQVIDGADNLDGNDMALRTDSMTYGDFSEDWMCLPLGAFGT